MIKKLAALALVAAAMTGCATVAEKTNFLTDEKVLSQSAGVLGYAASDLTLKSRRTEGTDTYANIKAKNGKEYVCVINGGNILSFGMTNPATCNKRD